MTDDQQMMFEEERTTRINVRLVVILLVVLVVLGGALFVGYKARSRVITARALAAGKTALEHRDWPEACRQLKVYLEKYPDDVDMLRQYAEAHLAMRPRRPENIGAALGAYRQLVRHVRDDEVAYHRLAALYFAIGDYTEAAYVAQQRLDVAPGDTVATIWKGRALVASRKIDQAEQLLVQFTQAHPEQIEAFVMLSQMALAARSTSSMDEALKWLDQAVASNPDSAEALARRGRFHFHARKDPTAARADYDRAEELPLEDPRVRLMLAEGWLDLGELDRAKAQMQQVSDLPIETVVAHDINPDDLTFVRLKAEAILAIRQRDREEGVRIAERGLKEQTGDRRISFMPFAAELYLADERTAQARECVEAYRAGVGEAAKQDQAITERLALLDAAVSLAESKPYDAIAVLAEPASQKLLYPQVYRLLWFGFDRTDQRRRGVSALEAYVTRQPGDRQARMDLVRGYLSVGAQSKALSLALDLERTDPSDHRARLLRLQASMRGGNVRISSPAGEAFIAELRTACEADRCNVEARSMLATALYAKGDVASAAGELEDTFKSCEKALSAGMRLVELHTLVGRRDLALQTARSAAERYPQEAEPLAVVADLLVADGKIQEAEQVLQDGMGRLAGDAKGRMTLALATFLANHDRPGEARDLLRQAAKERPSDIEVRLALLGLPLVQQDAAEAAALVEELRGIEKEQGTRWRYEKARLLLREAEWRKKSDEIVQLLRWCMTADPQWSLPVIELGRMYENLNRDDLAEAVYRRQVDAYPEQLMVASRLLDLLERQRRFGESQRILERLPQASTVLRGHWVKVAIGQEDYTTAINELEHRIKEFPKDVPTRVLLARLIHLARRDTPAALKLLDEAAAIRPDLITILSTRVAILHASNQDEEALALLDQEARSRHEPPILQMRAEFLAMLNRNADAERAFRELTAMPDAGAEGYEALARFLERQDRLADATAVCEEGLKHLPDSLPLNRLHVRLLALSPDPKTREKGVRRVEELLKRWPDDANFLTAQAGALLAEDDPASQQKAAEILEQVVRLNAGFILAHRYLIDLARGRGELQKASQLAARALGANPRNIEFLLIRADLENDLGNHLSARELALSVLNLDPRNLVARNLLVRVCLQAGDRAEAERFNNEAIELDPANEDVRMARAEILNLQDRRPEAIQVLDELVGHNSKPSPRIFLALADLYRLDGDYAKAEERLNQIPPTKDHAMSLLLSRIKLLAAQRRFDTILELLADHQRSYPRDSIVLGSVPAILNSVGAVDQLKRLKPLLDDFIAANPNRTEGPLIAATVDYAVGDLEATEKDYRRLLQIDPMHQQGLNNLAWIVGVELGRPEEALEIANKAIDRYSGDAHLLNTRGVLYYWMGMMTEARKDFEGCLALAQQPPATTARTLLYLGRTHLKEGATAKAKRAFEQAAEIDQRVNALSEAERSEIRDMLNAVAVSTTRAAVVGSMPATRP